MGEFQIGSSPIAWDKRAHLQRLGRVSYKRANRSIQKNEEELTMGFSHVTTFIKLTCSHREKAAALCLSNLAFTNAIYKVAFQCLEQRG